MCIRDRSLPCRAPPSVALRRAFRFATESAGAFDEPLEGGRLAGGPEHQAQARLQLVGTLTLRVVGGDAPADALGQGFRRRRVVLDEHDELVAARAGQHIRFCLLYTS